jgi:hypothetical protein
MVSGFCIYLYCPIARERSANLRFVPRDAVRWDSPVNVAREQFKMWKSLGRNILESAIFARGRLGPGVNKNSKPKAGERAYNFLIARGT